MNTTGKHLCNTRGVRLATVACPMSCIIMEILG